MSLFVQEDLTFSRSASHKAGFEREFMELAVCVSLTLDWAFKHLNCGILIEVIGASFFLRTLSRCLPVAALCRKN